MRRALVAQSWLVRLGIPHARIFKIADIPETKSISALGLASRLLDQANRQGTKVFWFFFSKKNILPFLAVYSTIWLAACRRKREGAICLA